MSKGKKEKWTDPRKMHEETWCCKSKLKGKTKYQEHENNQK